MGPRSVSTWPTSPPPSKTRESQPSTHRSRTYSRP
jgi:hypothetical protein